MKAYKHSEETRLSLLEQSINNINETMKRFEKRFDTLENKIDSGFVSVNKRIDEVNNRIWKNFYWLVSACSTITFFIVKYSPNFIK